MSISITVGMAGECLEHDRRGDRLDEAAFLAHSDRGSEVLDGDLSFDLHVERHLDEIEMCDLAPNRIPLDLAGDRQHLVPALDLEIDEGVEPGFGVEHPVQFARVDADGAGLESSAVDDGRHPAFPPQPASLAGPERDTTLGVQRLLLHGELSSGRRKARKCRALTTEAGRGSRVESHGS